MAISSRWIYFFIFACCTGLLAYALYTQYVDGLHPCPLCITQRAFFVFTGVVAVMALIFHPQQLGRYIAGGLMLVSCAAGGGFAYRQIWLQGLPPEQVPACGPSLEYMFENLPMSEAFSTLLMGDGNCAEVVWTMFGMSMPTWSLIAFVGLALAAVASALPWVRR
jgi:disulfide bond formation protein DsbB